MKTIRGYTHHDGSDFTSRTPEFRALSEGTVLSIAMAFRERQQTAPWETLSAASVATCAWVVDDAAATVGEALAAASKKFQEAVEIDGAIVMYDDVDRRPLDVQDRASRGKH